MALLTKIKSDHSFMRTDTVEGRITRMPELENTFQMMAAPLEGGTFRFIETSPIRKITENTEKKEIIFDTMFSKYKLEEYE